MFINPFGSGMANTEGFARTYDDSKPPTSSFARPRPPAKTNRPVGIIPAPNRKPNRKPNRSVGSSPHPICLASGHRIGCPDPDTVTASRRISVAGRSRTRLSKYHKTSEVNGQSHDIQPAVIDKATVPIDYESRIAKLSLNEAELPKVDSEFEEITEAETQVQVGRDGSDGRPGDGRLHEPPDLRGPRQRTHQAPSRLGQRP